MMLCLLLTQSGYERDGPMTPKAFHALFGRIGARAKMQFPIHPHMLGMAAATPWRTPATTHGRYRLGSATRTSSIRFDIPSFLPNGSGISGRIRTRQSLAAVTLSMERHGAGNNG